MILHNREASEETAVTLWLVGWLSSFPIVIFADNEFSWMAAAFVSLGLMVNGLLCARRAAHPSPARPPEARSPSSA